MPCLRFSADSATACAPSPMADEEGKYERVFQGLAAHRRGVRGTPFPDRISRQDFESSVDQLLSAIDLRIRLLFSHHRVHKIRMGHGMISDFMPLARKQ